MDPRGGIHMYSSSSECLLVVVFVWSCGAFAVAMTQTKEIEPCALRDPLRRTSQCELIQPLSPDLADSISTIRCPLSAQVIATFTLVNTFDLTVNRRGETEEENEYFDDEEQETIGSARRRKRDGVQDEGAETVEQCIGLQELVGTASNAASWSVSFNSSASVVGVVTASTACWKSRRTNSTSCNMEVLLSFNVWKLSQVRSTPSEQDFWICDETFPPITIHVQRTSVRANWLREGLSTCHALYGIALEDINLEAQSLTLPYLPRLQQLHLQGFIRLPPALWKSTPSLFSLSLRRCLLNGAPTGVSALRVLRVLNIDSDQGYAFYPQEFGQLPSLEELHLTRCAALNVAALREMPPLTRLRVLRLNWSATLKFDPEDHYDYFGKFPGLEELDLSHCGLRSICHSLLRPSRDTARLRVLRLAHNALDTIPPLWARRLDLLDLSFNAVESPANLGALNTSVRFLNLSANAVELWNNSDMFSLQNNGFIDGREIGENWVEDVDLTFNNMVALSNPMTESMDVVFSVDLRGNAFDCSDCDVLRWTQWIVTSGRVVATDELSCASPPEAVGLLLSNAASGPAPCDVSAQDMRHSIAVAAPLFALSLVTIVIAVTVGVRFRAEISYMMHLLRIRRERGDGEQESLYDAFVCYSGSDRSWVTRVLVPLLEAAPLRYRLCLHDRDFPLGALIVDNIVEAIERSRRTIIVLSPHFVASKWCQWELDMARHRCFEDSPAFLVLIQLGTLDRKRLPRHLRFLCDTRTLLEWPAGGAGTAIGAVRQRLRDALGLSLREQHALAPQAPPPLPSTDAFHDEAAADNATNKSLHRALVAKEADANGTNLQRDLAVSKMSTLPAIKGTDQTVPGDIVTQGKPFEGKGKGLKAMAVIEGSQTTTVHGMDSASTG